MKKTTPTPKEIAKRRLAKNPIMKIPLDELNNVVNKEDIYPGIIVKHNPFRKKDRVTENFGPRNPFDIPLLQRLFSKRIKPKKQSPEPFMMSDVHTVCDIDNTYFKIIEGRPLRRGDDIKVYMSNIRDICLFKANAAYMLDQILQMDASYDFELTEYRNICGMLSRLKKAFVKFANTNYYQSKKFQIIAEVRALQLERKSEELDTLCFEFVKLRNRLSDITLSYENLSRYRHFLNKLTPMWWKAENSDRTSTELLIATASNSILSHQISFRSGGSMEINRSQIERLKKVDSRFYFQEPRQLIDILEDMRRQCLNYIHMSAFSANILSSIFKSRDILKAQVEGDIKELESYIDIYNSLIKFEEEKETVYKKVFDRILINEFHELFASFDASKLFTCVQYVNTKIFEQSEDPKDNITMLMYNLEKYFFDLSLSLDDLDVEIVKKATKQAFAEDKAKIAKAHRAQRIIKECDILRKSLYASFEPPRSNKKQVTAT